VHELAAMLDELGRLALRQRGEETREDRMPFESQVYSSTAIVAPVSTF
jgi:hypothetical protein